MAEFGMQHNFRVFARKRLQFNHSGKVSALRRINESEVCIFIIYLDIRDYKIPRKKSVIVEETLTTDLEKVFDSTIILSSINA